MPSATVELLELRQRLPPLQLHPSIIPANLNALGESIDPVRHLPTKGWGVLGVCQILAVSLPCHVSRAGDGLALGGFWLQAECQILDCCAISHRLILPLAGHGPVWLASG